MASTNKLYPPIIAGVLPAFYKVERLAGDTTPWIIKITVPFGMNQMVGQGQVKSIFLRLKTVQTNEVKYCAPTDRFDLDAGIAYFELNQSQSDLLKEGLFYKAQIAYCDVAIQRDATGTIISMPEAVDAGYFSTVSITKCIAKPIVAIANFDSKKVNLYNNRYLGTYEQDIEKGDSNEKVYSYCFTITDKDGNTYITSGIQLHNTNNDINHWSSEDEFLVNKLLVPGEIYYLTYSVTTVNGLQLSSPTYRLMAGESVDMEKAISLLPELNYDEGYIQINMRGPRRYRLDSDNAITILNQEDYCSGQFLLSRGCFRDDYMVWEDIARFNLNNELPSNHIERDFTIEQGVTYKYRLQQYNKSGVYSNPIYSDEIYADFEDMFLYDGVRQLKVRFNPKVASFKVDIPEQKLETIGSKYPFIFRNGNVYYHEFPISGLISYQLDEAKLFLTEEEQLDGQVFENNMAYEYATAVRQGWQQVSHQMRPITQEEWEAMSPEERAKHPLPTEITEQYPVRSVKQTLNNNKLSPIRMDKDLTSENHMSERYFKLAVLAWLTNGEVKLFRSPGEGNYLVRLLNTSLTPNDTLGRMLHTFNTTAYEIADLTYENLLYYKLINVANPNLSIIQFSTIEFTPNVDGSSTVLYESDGDIISGFEVNDCVPGDQILVTYGDDHSTELITIGVTGSYHFDAHGRPIESVLFYPAPDTPFNYPHSITLEYVDEQKHYFDLIANVGITTVVSRTYYGPQNNLVNSVVGDTNNLHKFNIKLGQGKDAYKTRLLDMEILRIRRREIIPIYEVETDLYSVTPYGKGYPIEELTQMSSVDQEIINRFAIFAIYVPDNTNIIATSHLVNNITDNSTDTLVSIPYTDEPQDKHYNELYPDWIFSKYYDQHNNPTFYTTAPKLQFAINTELDNNDLSWVDLSTRDEMTLYHLGPIQMLALGNGVIAETVMRIQVIDYTLEDTDKEVSETKNNYLTAKSRMFDDYAIYVNTNTNAMNEYNTYLAIKTKYDQALAQYNKISETLVMFRSLVNNTDVYIDDIKNITTNIVNAINSYINNYYATLVAYIGHNHIQAPSDVVLLPKPTVFTTTGENNDLDQLHAIIDAKDPDIPSATLEVLTTLSNKLNEVSQVFITVLNDYQDSIPNMDNIINILPADWDANYWDTHEVPEIVRSLSHELLLQLQQMYQLLRYSGEVNIFTDDYFINKSLPTNRAWTEAEGQIVIDDQANVGGIELVTEDTFENNETTIIYDPNSTILALKTAYITADTELQELIEIRDDCQTAVEALMNKWAQVCQPINDWNNNITTLLDDIETQRKAIEASNELISHLEQEPPTENNLTAIEYLNLRIRLANAKIAEDQNSIQAIHNRIEAYMAQQRKPNDPVDMLIYSEVESALDEAQAALTEAEINVTTKQNSKNLFYNAYQQAITDWNNKLSIIIAYIDILKRVDTLHELGLSELQEQISQYHRWYNELVDAHNIQYSEANNTLNEMNSLYMGFAKLNELIDEWEAQKVALEPTIATEPTPVDPPVEFAWDYYIDDIKRKWEIFILKLQQKYQEIEARYFA